jgi:tetratricopeptide (TPR) repeat protein
MSALEHVVLAEPPVTPVPLALAPRLEPVVDEERAAFQAAVVEAEAAVAESRYADALAALAGRPVPAAAHADLALRALFADSWARMYLGDLQSALARCERARAIAEGPHFTDADRAEALYRLGCVRVKLNAIAAATSLFTLALELAERSGLPCDRLRAEIFEWRSRCHQRRRDFEAAREDVERALELTGAIGDEHVTAHVYFRASVIAERTGQWLLARFYAEHARTLYERHGDRANTGRLLNNLGGLTFLLGDPDEAKAYLKQAVSVALDTGSDADAAQAINSLAQVHLRTGEAELAEQQARYALELLAAREDFLDEVGNAQLVLGRALLAQGRHGEAEGCFAEADASFERLDSASHRAAAWMAQGDLAAARGDKDGAIERFRTAAETLQDFHF